jgi:hypothetical protein
VRPLTLLGREVESIVPELVEDEVAKPLGVFEITSVETGFIEVDERVSQKRVVVEEARHLGRAVLPGPIEATVWHAHPLHQEIGCAPGGLKVQSTLMLMKRSFIRRAMSGFSNDSCAMT